MKTDARRRMQNLSPPLLCLEGDAGMKAELRKAQLLRRFNDAEHRPAEIAGREIFISIPGGEVRALLYAPEKTAPAPLFIDLHGGAYIFGSPEEDDDFCAALCRTLGMAVVSLDYPLAPEARHPVAIEQIYAAIQSLRSNAERWGIDPMRVAIGGHSAGACLAAAVCMLVKDRGDLPLLCQMLDHPALDLGCTLPQQQRHRDPLELKQALLDFGAHCYASPEQYASDPLCTPCIAGIEEMEGLPPAIVLTCERDSLRTEGEVYAGMLIRSGVKLRFMRFPGAIHGFTVFPGPLRAEGQKFLFDSIAETSL